MRVRPGVGESLGVTHTLRVDVVSLGSLSLAVLSLHLNRHSVQSVVQHIVDKSLVCAENIQVHRPATSSGEIERISRAKAEWAMSNFKSKYPF